MSKYIACFNCGWLSLNGEYMFKINDKYACINCTGFYSKEQVEKIKLNEDKVVLQYIYREQEKFTNMESFKMWLKQEIDKIKFIKNDR